MINLSLKALAEVLGVESTGLADAGFNGVTIDSRQSCDGKLFVAIKGDNFDGHQFVETAYRNGALVARDCAHRQQWQDHGQGNAVPDTGSQSRDPRHHGQLQQ
jgi:UDP-N-acetylmuramyl pentapeptide synthase